MNKKRVAFLTLGCKVNSYETDAMSKLFSDNGYEIVNFNSESDIYIVNTCSVTNMADRKSRQMLHKAKRNNTEGIIVATGCYVQASASEVSEDDAIDLLVGNNKKSEIVNIVEEYIAQKRNEDLKNKKQKTIEMIDINSLEECVLYEDMFIDSAGENTRAYIKIQDGCNQFCSYCIIPYARGRIRSREKSSILNEVENLANNGYKEVVLTGIHISSYGLDFEKEKIKGFKYEYLLDVIQEISLIKGIERIRLGSLEPRIISEEFISELSKIDKVCPHFHLSLQSGCDETLKRMNRKYTTMEYASKCDIIRKYYDNPAITTDVIVGFPGETGTEFEKTVDFLEKIKFAEMHVFKYSVRKGTVAAKMDNQVNEQDKTLRSKVLLEMNSKNHTEYMSTFVGKKEKVLFEEKISINNSEYYVGHNERYIKVVVGTNDINNNFEICDDDICNNIFHINIECVMDDDRLKGNLDK